MNRPSGMLFDLDGTVLDTAPEFAHCLNQLLADMEKPAIGVLDLREHVSYGTRGMIQFAFSDHSDESLPQRFRDLYEDTLGHKTELFSGMAELLSWLSAQSIPWGIVTNKPLRYAEPLVAQFPELAQRQCLIAGDSLPTSKPDPAPLLAGCAAIQCTPANTWYIGDSLSDLKASRNAGMPCVLADYGYLPRQENTRAWAADHYIAQPKELIEILS